MFYTNRSPTQGDDQSLQAALEVFKKGNSNEDVLNYYNKWAKDGKYDTDTGPERYRVHILACEDVEKFFSVSPDKVKVIDIGAGTGKVGVELVKKGFKLIDALEPCAGMFEEAKKLNIYQNHINVGIDAVEKLPIKDNAYDLAIVSGAMGEGHIPCEGIYEMARIVRPGGLITMVFREEFLETCTQYKGRLEPLMKKMEEDGVWKILARDIRLDYYLDKPGIVFKFSPC